MTRLIAASAAVLLVIGIGPAPPAAAGQQAPAIRPVSVGAQMPDFTLPSYQGPDVTLSKLKGKNVLLVFLRGRSGPASWCHICNYQHWELVDHDAKAQIRAKANLEILFVLPYGRALVKEWLDTYIAQLNDIEGWRNPDPAKMDDVARRRMNLTKTAFPKTFKVTPADLPGPFPVLVDADQAVSKGLGLFSLEWGGSKVEQNIPAVYLVDAEGTLQFKYSSQNTLDRPPLPYLVRMVGLLTRPR